MKKLLTGILATLTCFTCATAVACGDEKGPDLTNLNAAKDNLYSTYISKDVESYQDYEVSNSIAYDGVLYSVTWSVNVGEEIAAIKPGSTNKLSLVDLNNTSETNVPYTLTATIADADGNTVTVSFERTLLKAPQLTPEAITAAPVAGTTYKLYVYQSSKAADCYFSGMMSGFYFQTVENYEEAADVYVEYKADSTTEFYLYFNHVTDGKQYIGVQEGWNSAKSYWTFNVVFNATPPSAFVWSDEHKTIITTVPCRSDADNKNPDATEQPNTKTLYLGNYSTYMTISASTIDKAATSNVGGLVEMIDKKNVAPEKKIATIKEDLNVQLNHKMNKQIELVTADERFSDVTIAWAVEEGKGAVLTDNKLALTIPATATTVKLTATIACGETTDTKEFTLNLGPAIVLGDNPTSAEIVAAAFELENGEALPNKYTLEGVITKVNTAYSADYKNVTVTISVEGKEIECFRMKGDGADVIKAGDTINVTGTIKNYNGKVEFDSGCTLNSYVAGTETPDTPPAGGTEEPTGNSVTAPVAGTAYNMYLEQNGANKVLYLTGVMSGNYLATTTDATQAADLYVEVATGGFYLYFLGADNAKSYITLTERQDGNYWKASVSLTTEGSTVFQYNQAGCWAATLANETFFLGTYGTYETISASSSFYMKDFGTAQYPALICADGGITTTTPPAGGNGGTETPPAGDEATLIASINMMGSTNKVSITDTQTVYQANGITYTNDKSSSRTNNSNYNPTTYAMRAYQGSKITISSTTAFTKVVFTLDDYENGKYLLGFDGMTIAGATITRNNDVVTITFDTAVTEFSTTDLPSQVRIEKIDLY